MSDQSLIDSIPKKQHQFLFFPADKDDSIGSKFFGRLGMKYSFPCELKCHKLILGCAIISLFIVLLPSESWSQLPTPPKIEGLSPLEGQPSLAEDLKIGTVQVAIGGVHLIPSAGNGIYSLSQGGDNIGIGDVLSTDAEGRCQIVLTNDDIIRLGKNSVVGLEGTVGDWTLNVWKGSALVYAYPKIIGAKGQKKLQLSSGTLSVRAGKVGVTTSADASSSLRISAFKGSFEWNNGEATVAQVVNEGQVLVAKASVVDIERLGENDEQEFNAQTSPEIPSMKAGIAAYEAKKYDEAIKRLGPATKAFPQNGQALYFLGLAHLAKEELDETIRHWRSYETVDPQGALEKKIAQQLTVLISKKIKDEVKKALKDDQSPDTAKAEPGSVAVSPFNSKGSEKFKALAKGITAIVIADLSKVPGIKVLEREKMQKVLEEIELSQSGLVDEKAKVRAGQVMRAEKIVMGDYTID